MAMDMIQINQEIYSASHRMSKAADTLYSLGKSKAESEQAYRVKLAQEMIKLKTEGMSIGMIADVAKGNVGDYLFKRDYDETIWKAAIESIGAIQTQISALQSIIKYQNEV